MMYRSSRRGFSALPAFYLTDFMNEDRLTPMQTVLQGGGGGTTRTFGPGGTTTTVQREVAREHTETAARRYLDTPPKFGPCGIGSPGFKVLSSKVPDFASEGSLSLAQVAPLISALSAAEQARFAAMVTTFRAANPNYPLDLFPLMIWAWEQEAEVGGGLKLPHWQFVILRTGPDPRPYRYPVIRPNTHESAIFDAALNLFFPDRVFDEWGQAHNKPNLGSNPGGPRFAPFPWGELWVTPDMVSFLVAYIRRSPEDIKQWKLNPSVVPFGDPVTPQTFHTAVSLLTSAGAGVGVGLQVGAVAGPYAGAIAGGAVAVGGFLYKAFSFLANRPDPPAWLLELSRVRDMRGGSLVLDGRMGKGPTEIYPCTSMYPNPKGTYNLLDGYAEVLKRLGGGGSGLPWWLLLAAAGVGALALGS